MSLGHERASLRGARPLELACEDANYQIVGVDYYGRASNPSAAFPGPKRKLIPENPKASAANNEVTISWDPLPSCGQDPTHVLTGYTVVKSKTSVSTCVGTMPLDPNSYETVSSVFPAVTSLTYNPTGSSANWYWYRVYATWGPSGPSDWSAGACISASGSVTEILDPGEGLTPENPEGSWKVARHEQPGTPASGLWRGEESKLTMWECDPAQADAICPGSGAPDDASREADAESPHRIIGQVGEIGSAERLTFYHVDHLGTPRVITDPNGDVVSMHKYLPFGEGLTDPPSTNSHEFTGHERDAETGMDYVLARYYSPAGIFRFATVDPGDDTQLERVQSWNSYTYAAQNPIAYIDPDGRKITYSGIDEKQTARAEAKIVELAEASPTFAAVYDAHRGTAGPDLDIWVGDVANPDWSGWTDANISPSGTYVNARIEIDIELNRWTSDLTATLIHEFGHVQDYMNNPVQALLEAGTAGAHGATGHKRQRPFVRKVKSDYAKNKTGRTPNPKVHKQRGNETPGRTTADLQAQGNDVRVDGGSMTDPAGGGKILSLEVTGRGL